MGWFTRREIARKGKTRIVHYATVHAHVRRAATQHIHDGNPRPCKLAPPLFSPPACLDIYCFNLPWPCLIMESSFWPPTAARPHRLSRRFCVYTWRGRREERNGCSANRLWIRARCTFRGTSGRGLFLNGRDLPIFKGGREFRAYFRSTTSKLASWSCRVFK